jgi:SAM-dependent methyltransferase
MFPLMGLGRRLIQTQWIMSRRLDSLLPMSYRVDGHRDFRESFAPRYLEAGFVVLDVGGGRHPFVDSETKRALDLRVIGVDICAEELRQAPLGSYDDMICCDVARMELPGTADLAICQAVLEHVRDTQGAIARVAQALKPGGRLIIFAPSRHAVFARLNLVMPEKLKTWILSQVFPDARHNPSFVAYYDRCTPHEILSLARAQGLVLLEKRTYFLSWYFAFLFPLYVLWRIWTVIFRAIAAEQAAETFSMAFEKPRDGKAIAAT